MVRSDAGMDGAGTGLGVGLDGKRTAACSEGVMDKRGDVQGNGYAEFSGVAGVVGFFHTSGEGLAI